MDKTLSTDTSVTATPSADPLNTTTYPVIAAISFSHLLNDMMQSVLLAIYPLLKLGLNLSFAQIGLITLVFQLTSSLLQPVAGLLGAPGEGGEDDEIVFDQMSEEELLAGKCQTLDEILPEVLAEVKPFEAQFGHDIPVFVAGGVYTGEDIAHYTKMGAAGAQLATRFIPTYECDASQTYKDVLLAARPEDVRIIHSPVGMPGRALATPLVQKLEQGLRFPPKHCARCLKACEPAKVPYCITHALIEAVKGNVEEGLFFCGANVGRLDRMRSVRELMDELMDDWRKHQ